MANTIVNVSVSEPVSVVNAEPNRSLPFSPDTPLPQSLDPRSAKKKRQLKGEYP
jgi:hypothetical protein